jgi:hypothetical protein
VGGEAQDLSIPLVNSDAILGPEVPEIAVKSWFVALPDSLVPGLHFTDTAFGRSRPAADASREVVERWLLDGLM